MGNVHFRWLGAVALILAAVAPPAGADEKGDGLLREALSNLKAAQSLTADISYAVALEGAAQVVPAYKGTISLKKPNLLRAEMKGTRGMVYVSDGKNSYNYSEGSKQYFKRPLPDPLTTVAGPWGTEINAFFGGEKLMPPEGAVVAGTEKIGDVECDLVKATQGTQSATVYAIGKADHCIYRTVMTVNLGNNRKYTRTVALSNLKRDVEIADDTFVFTAPEGMKEWTPPPPVDYNAKLVPIGTAAPDFTVPNAAGGEISLTKAREGKKAILVNFWFYG